MKKLCHWFAVTVIFDFEMVLYDVLGDADNLPIQLFMSMRMYTDGEHNKRV